MAFVSGVLTWCTYRLGLLSSVPLVALSVVVIRAAETSSTQQPGGVAVDTPCRSGEVITDITYHTLSKVMFAYYTLFIHVLVFAFSVRACWAVWTLTRRLREGFVGSKKDERSPWNSSRTCVRSEEEQHIEPTTDHRTTHLERVIHAIIIPNYKEDIDTLRDTLDVLASHKQAATCYELYLAMELRESSGEVKALMLVRRFAGKFRKVCYTLHPEGLAGEAAGKGSNLAWAASLLIAEYSPEVRLQVIVTVIDADSHLLSKYFSEVSRMHTSYTSAAATTLYVAPIIFDRNAQQVPALVRVADIFWSAAGISGLYEGSAIAPPTSVYSLPLTLVERVGGWDGGPEAVGEDLHMYLKCYFALNGHLTCQTILAPVSQSNVTGSELGADIANLVSHLQARYRQALRHMWGALDSGYTIQKSLAMWRNRSTDWTQPPRVTDVEVGKMCANLEQREHLDDKRLAVEADEPPRPEGWRVLYLFHRLFEAHFLPVHMTIVVIASIIYSHKLGHNAKEGSLGLIWHGSSLLRTGGLVMGTVYLRLYERMHSLCTAWREREMTAAGLADGAQFSRRRWSTNWMDYLVVPIVAPLYGSIPCMHALLRHLWTFELVYTVSKKAVRQKSGSLVSDRHKV